MVSVPIQDYHDVLNCLPEIIFKKKKIENASQEIQIIGLIMKMNYAA